MKVIGIEEHFLTPDVLTAWRALDPQWRDLSLTPSTEGDTARRLGEFDVRRLSAMDEAGVDVQVLSLSTPGVQNLLAADAVVLAEQTNDMLAATIAGNPDRFGGFATLPTPDPRQRHENWSEPCSSSASPARR